MQRERAGASPRAMAQTTPTVVGVVKERKARLWRRKNRPVVITLVLLVTSLATLLIAMVFVYRSEIEMKTLASYDPQSRDGASPDTTGDFLSLEIRVVSLDLNAGVGRVIINKISPNGRYAVVPDADFIGQEIALFINGNQNTLPAGLPAKELESRITFSEGRANAYPFDRHNGTLTIYASTTSELNRTVTALANNTPLAGNPFIPLKWRLTGGLQSFVISGSYPKHMADASLLDLEVSVGRSGLTKFFSIMIMTFMWLISLTMVGLVLDVVLKRREVPLPILSMNGYMLFALPALRASQPSIGPVGTVGDVFGFFWNITLVSVSFVLISVYWVSKMHHDTRQLREKQAREQIEKLKEKEKIPYQQQILHAVPSSTPTSGYIISSKKF